MITIEGIVPENTYGITFSKGQWFGEGLAWRNPWGYQPFERIIGWANESSDPVHMIFRDQQQIRLFLQEENPVFAQIQHVIILSQHYKAQVALTRDEIYPLFRQMNMSKMVKGPTWIDTLRSVQLDNSLEQHSPLYKWFCSSSQWNLSDATSGGGAEFRFREFLNFQGAVRQIITRQPQRLLEGFRTELVMDDEISRRELQYENSLVVPDDLRFPVRSNRFFTQYRDIYPTAGKTLTATMYPAEAPELIGSVSPPVKMVKRSVPFDVQVANS